MPDRLGRGGELALCVVPLAAQLVAQGAAFAALRPPTDAGTAAYAPSYGVVILAGYAGLLAGTAWTARRLGTDVGLEWPGARRVVGFAGLAIVLVVIAGAVIDPLFGGTREQQRSFDPISYPGGARAAVAIALVGLVLVVIGPFAEELYFRGLLLTTLGGGTAALLIQAAVFAALHLIPAALPVLFLDGVVFGWVRRRSGSIWPGVLAHAFNNALALAIVLGS